MTIKTIFLTVGGFGNCIAVSEACLCVFIEAPNVTLLSFSQEENL
jgi:hypothetical protein